MAPAEHTPAQDEPGVISTTRWSRTARTCLAGALAAIAALSLSVAAAPAQAKLSDCPDRNVCVWNGWNYTGDIFIVSGYAGYTDLPAYVHDHVHSAASNNHERHMCLIDWHNGHQENRLTLKPGDRDPVLLLDGTRGPDAVQFC
jgi:peptidase inhibitor family I36